MTNRSVKILSAFQELIHPHSSDFVMTGCRMDTAILVTRSNTLAMGLDALLLSISPIKHVEWAADPDVLVELLSEINPTLIVIDTDILPPDPAVTLDQINERSPNALRVLLSDDMTEYRELAYDDGSNLVILKGADPGRLARAIEFLLNKGGAV